MFLLFGGAGGPGPRSLTLGVWQPSWLSVLSLFVCLFFFSSPASTHRVGRCPASPNQTVLHLSTSLPDLTFVIFYFSARGPIYADRHRT